MADEKTGNDVSKTPDTGSSTGAPQQSGAPVPQMAQPPVTNMMPHQEIVPTEPVVTPQKPPITSVMPSAPETKLDLDAPSPPNYAEIAASVRLSDKPKSPRTASPAQATTQPAPGTPANTTPTPQSAQDSIEAEVGLTRPSPKAADPDPMRTDMTKLLAGIKLPEKRSYTPRGEKRAAPTPPTEQPSLDAVLAARITENNPSPVPDSAGVPPKAPGMHVPEQEVFHDEYAVESVHTLKQDLQQVVREQKMSVVRAVTLEQEKRKPERIVEEAPKSRAPLIALTVILMLLLGAGALGGVYYVATLQTAPNDPVQDSALVFAEQTVAFELTSASPQSLKSALAQARNSGGALGSIMHVIPVVNEIGSDGSPTQRPATLTEFFSAIGATAPENLMRALGEEFFLGVHTVDKNAPILVIQVESYDRAFDGMLTWEKGINGDLAPVFAAVPRLVMGEDGIQVERTFTDLVMRNYDVRALKDDAGVIQLFYSFPTRDLLVIAESPYTFTEILSRLQAGRRL